MHVYIDILGRRIPTYGLMITTGVVLANLIVLLLRKKLKVDTDDVILLEAYMVIGMLVGSKLLYLITVFPLIEWNRFFEPDYFVMLMQGGFVFYGGLFGALAMIFLAGRIHKINAVYYIKKVIFLCPFAHAFGRIGCFNAGCCYGIPYHGPGAVVFPEDSFAIPGIELFPVQLLEMATLFLISLILGILTLRFHSDNTVEWYLILYGTDRFFLEFLRYDAGRGIYGPFSTSQWISIVAIAGAVFWLIRKRRMKRKAAEVDKGQNNGTI